MSREKFVLEGPEALQPILDISLGEILYQSILSYRKKAPALINGHNGKSITYPELLKATCSLAEALRNAGYGPNTVISISSKNNLEFFIPVISALYIGATVAPINHGYTPTELNHILNMTKPKIIFCSEDLVGKYSEMKKNMNFIEEIVVINSEKSTMQALCMKDFIGKYKGTSVSRFLTTPVDLKDQVAFILCSSGTTGLPKGVMLTHWNMNTKYNHFLDHRYHIQNPTSLCILPFFHAYGLFTTLIGIMMNSLTVFLEEFQPNIFLKSIQEYRVSRLYLAPSLVVFLAKSLLVLQYNLSSVNETYCGAAPLKKSTQKEFLKRFHLKTILQAYGLTESTLAVTACESNMPAEYKAGSSGKLYPHVKIGIRDTETGEFLGPNRQGEICIKSDLVMKGYYGNPEATKNTFTEDGWLLTGDAGYYDEDGYFFITDRLKELIKYKGFQVAPAEIEALLLTHEEIIDSGVVGLPDERSGELPLAFVVKAKNSKLTETDVQDFVQSKLSAQKWLRGGVIFIDAIPKNPTGKILRRDLSLMLKKYKSKL